MKKIIILFFILSILTFFSNIILAEEFSFELYDVSTNSSTTTINWDVSKITPGENKWVWSTTYAKIRATGIASNIFYRIYQDNTNAGNDYFAKDPRTVNVFESSTTFSYSGLVNKERKGGETWEDGTGGFVPLSYTMTTKKLSASDFQKDYDPDAMIGSNPAPPDGIHRAARYFIDIKDYLIENEEKKESFSYGYYNNKKYSVIACNHGPTFWVYDGDGIYRHYTDTLVDHTAYLYFGGNFGTAYKESDFGASRIIIERWEE